MGLKNVVKNGLFFFRTIALIALFSQYLSNVKIPVPGYSKERRACYLGHYPLFRLFPVSIIDINERNWRI